MTVLPFEEKSSQKLLLKGFKNHKLRDYADRQQVRSDGKLFCFKLQLLILRG